MTLVEVIRLAKELSLTASPAYLSPSHLSAVCCHILPPGTQPLQPTPRFLLGLLPQFPGCPAHLQSTPYWQPCPQSSRALAQKPPATPYQQTSFLAPSLGFLHHPNHSSKCLSPIIPHKPPGTLVHRLAHFSAPREGVKFEPLLTRAQHTRGVPWMPRKPAKLTAPQWKERRKSDSSRKTDRQTDRGAEKARETEPETERLGDSDLG